MSARPKSLPQPSRLNGYTAASLWHHRLVRSNVPRARVQPRLVAELTLHPVISHGMRVDLPHSEPRGTPLDVSRAA